MGKILSQKKKNYLYTLKNASKILLHRREITYGPQKKHYQKFGTYSKNLVLMALG